MRGVVPPAIISHRRTNSGTHKGLAASTGGRMNYKTVRKDLITLTFDIQNICRAYNYHPSTGAAAVVVVVPGLEGCTETGGQAGRQTTNQLHE